MTLGDRIQTTLLAAGLNPRHLGGATRIHFVTIYRAMSKDTSSMIPSHEQILTNAMNKIDALVERGDLPFSGKLSRKEKTDRLTALLNND